MRKFRSRRKWLSFDKGLPRLNLHEKNEGRVRWTLRSLTTLGIVTSVIAFPWYVALSLSLVLAGLDWWLERTLFYYSSMYVDSIMSDYDPEEWLGMVVVSIGKPTDPASKKILGLAFRTEDYARKFFETLHRWNGTKEGTQQDLMLTIIVDEDTYFVYLYSSIEKDRIRAFKRDVEEEAKYDKYGKEHSLIVMQQIFCRGFTTTKEFAVGVFLETTPAGTEFLLAPYTLSGDRFIAVSDATPIIMRHYKSKIPDELDESDYEYFHWQRLVDRSAVGAHA